MSTKCTGCYRTFTTVNAFDKHRTGDYTRFNRRCMSAIEMIERRLEQKSTGKWGHVASEDMSIRITALRRIA